MNIGDLIKKYRKEKGLSQLDLCLKIGWENPSTLSRIEKGEVKPNRETLLKICESLNIDSNHISHILKMSGYFEIEPKITAEYLQYLKESLIDEINKFKFPVCVMNVNTIQLLSNNDMLTLFYNDFSNNLEDKSHIEILFDAKYGIKQKIINWDIFYKQLIETIYKVYKITHGDQEFQNIINSGFIYKEFEEYWKVLEKENYNDFNFYSNIMVFQHTNSKISKYSVSAFPLHSDKRFLIQQFIPIE